MAIETAIVAPVLILMAMGSFQVSSMVARQSELQNAAAEAAAIALASTPESQSALDTVRDVIKVSADIESEDISVEFSYRCENAADRVADPETCASDDTIWTYMDIKLESTYEPIWKKLGIGSNVKMVVERTVQIS